MNERPVCTISTHLGAGHDPRERVALPITDREHALEQQLEQQRIESLEKQLKEALEANDFLIKELQARVTAMERM